MLIGLECSNQINLAHLELGFPHGYLHDRYIKLSALQKEFLVPWSTCLLELLELLCDSEIRAKTVLDALWRVVITEKLTGMLKEEAESPSSTLGRA
jgi:hypothetical protein